MKFSLNVFLLIIIILALGLYIVVMNYQSNDLRTKIRDLEIMQQQLKARIKIMEKKGIRCDDTGWGSLNLSLTPRERCSVVKKDKCENVRLGVLDF